MIIQFQDSNGNPITGSVLDIGASNNAIVGLKVDGQGQVVVGGIFKNTTKIGDFTYNSPEDVTINWYGGEGRPIYVNNGDTLNTTTTTPTATNKTLLIKRVQPDIAKTVSMGEFVKKVAPMAPGSVSRNRIRSVMNQVSQETQYEHSISESTNVRYIKEYLTGAADLPNQNSYIYGTITELNNAFNTQKPPSALDIFNTWARFNHNSYYPDPSTIPPESEAAAWYWDPAREAAVMPLNSETFLGFVSHELVDYYDHETMILSGNADDDYNGLLLAYVHYNGISYHLSVTACRDGYNMSTPEVMTNLHLRYNWGVIVKENNANNERGNGWVGQRKWLKVSRRGDQFHVYASRWNSDTYDPALTMTVNLNDDPRFAIFKGPQRYGYCNYSQADTTFNKIKYFGGILRDTIIDAVNNRVYRYNVDTGWTLLPGVKAQDVYGAPRTLTNPDDGKRYRLNLDGTITFL